MGREEGDGSGRHYPLILPWALLLLIVLTLYKEDRACARISSCHHHHFIFNWLLYLHLRHALLL